MSDVGGRLIRPCNLNSRSAVGAAAPIETTTEQILNCLPDNPRSILPGSIVEMLHPDGFVERTLTLGKACPETLLPGGVGREASGPAGLVILAPTVTECRSKGWLAHAVGSAAAGLGIDGVAYVLVPRVWRRSVRRLLVEAGLELELELLHLPDARRTRHLVPLDRTVLDYLSSVLLSAGSWEQRVLALAGRLPTALTRTLASVGFVARPAEARPAFEWLYELDDSVGARGPVVVSRSWHPLHAGLVLHRFGHGASLPSAIAKLRLDGEGADQTLREAETLTRLRPHATAAGAEVPRPLALARVGTRPVLLETALRGQPAALALRSNPRRLVDVLEHVVEWLVRWHKLTGASAPLTRPQLERELVRPAAELVAGVGGGETYAAWISRRCVESEGRPMPRVAVHNDLTMWNVLLDEDAGFAVVDWEGAEGSALPLGDFYYAAVDAVSAVHGYRSRLAAFEDCFAPEGEHARTVARLRAPLLDVLDLTRAQAELCFHACWLRQATDPRRAGRAADREPFLQIVGLIAQDAIGARRFAAV